MPPKKNNKKKGKQQEQFANEQKIISKWAQALEQPENGQQEQPDAEQIYSKPTKQIYQFDFSNQRALDQKGEEQKPQKDKYEGMTEQQIAQCKRLEEKQKLIKQAKKAIKKQKEKQRKKEIDALKVVQKIEKQKQQQENKKVQQQIKKNKKKESSPWLIPGFLLLFLFVMLFLQYKQQIHERLAKFRKDDDIDFYQILQADSGITDKDLKNKYKKLVMKYHPDRNPQCQNCKQKFDGIMKAWQVLGDPEKRKLYDQNSGHISQLKSQSVTLSPSNFAHLISQSSQLWMIQVYDSTNSYSPYFAQFWEEMFNNYGDVIKFGRVDIWNQPEMSSYLPYNFQVFPAVYTVERGYSQMCTFNFQRPIQGLKKCIQGVYEKVEQKVISQIPTKISNQNNKLNIYADAKLRANLRVKAIHNMLADYFNVFYVEKQLSKGGASQTRQVKVFHPLRSSDNIFSFNFTGNTKKSFQQYSLFLQSLIIQKVSTCKFLQKCQQSRCLLVLNETATKVDKIQKSLPLLKSSDDKPSYMSVYMLADSKAPHVRLQQKIQHIQELHNEKFEFYQIGLYENGRVDIGYVEDVPLLDPEQGQRLELQCKNFGIWDKLLNWGVQLGILSNDQKS